ncbi:minor capsid protein [Metasolibacillus meyeri]|uniref:minor capsid protein n=1 Tax=Metasolibacillus meyeri TaxID=1071052 RepID=UPI00187D6CDF|nr:minor capsid protein [Metasolibacillus meyeri]
MRVRIKRQLDGVPIRLSNMTKQGQYAFVNQVYADSNIYVPMLSSDLRNQSSIGVDGKSITWHSVYARRQYYNIGAKFTTPGTGPKWDSKALAIHGDSWKRVVVNAMNRAR